MCGNDSDSDKIDSVCLAEFDLNLTPLAEYLADAGPTSRQSLAFSEALQGVCPLLAHGFRNCCDHVHPAPSRGEYKTKEI